MESGASAGSGDLRSGSRADSQAGPRASAVAGPGSAPGGPRRSPGPGERKRDAERTKERIIEAAAREFAAKGLAGARVAAIASAAGVNQQLISYYFGGKQGLYEELGRRWAAAEAPLADPALSHQEMVAGYFSGAIERPDWARMLLWQALGDAPDETAEAGQRREIKANVEDIRRRQQLGEISGDYPAEFILVVLWAAAMAPVSLPQVVRGAYDCDAESPAFRDAYLPHLQRLFLAPPRPS